MKDPSGPLAVPVVLPFIKMEAPVKGPSADTTFPFMTLVCAFNEIPRKKKGIIISSFCVIFPI